MKKVEKQIEKEDPLTYWWNFLRSLPSKSAKIKKITKISILSLLFLIISIGTISPSNSYLNRKRNLGPEILKIKRKIELNKFNIKLRNEKPDLFILAMRESALGKDTVPNYKAYNKFGYIGAWQIHVSYLPSLGIYGVTLEDFINNPDETFPFEVQLQAVENLITKNIEYLGWYYDYYPGKRAHGIRITEEGMIFAAHLGGVWGLKKFLRTGRNPRDAYGTSIRDYLDYKNTFWYQI